MDSLARRECILDRKSLHQALANYAIKHAWTDVDLDSGLEAAATDHLLQQNQNNETGPKSIGLISFGSGSRLP